MTFPRQVFMVLLEAQRAAHVVGMKGVLELLCDSAHKLELHSDRLVTQPGARIALHLL